TIIVGLLLFLRFKVIQEKKTNIKDANLKLALKEQEILALKVKEESKNVQALSLELLMKKDFSSKLVKELDQLENITYSEIKNIEIFIQNELEVKSDRAHLQSQMGNLSSNFYTELKIHHQNLTEKELRLAAMVVMQLSNKEIAISKNTTLESAKKSKNRLKKKLNISIDSDLTAYLQEFL
ncbi:MAG: hypothetical protein P8Q14_08535, partial [Vicingaceae bacterium]|nr:hypothetical protein [Vicingaceae bacterium]